MIRILLVVIAVLLAACSGKHAGGSCKGNGSVCQGKTSALVCRAGTYTEVACSGSLGCSNYQEHANCDTSVAKEGDGCMGDDDERACSPDKKRALVCKNGKFVLESECRGANGCSMLGRTSTCDTTIAVKNDPCKSQGAVACDADQKHMLVCRDGRFVLHRYCRGQYGCSPKDETPTCDETLSLAGDPCGMPGQVVCAVDGASELVCQGGIFTTSLKCRKGCTVTSRPGRPIDCR